MRKKSQTISMLRIPQQLYDEAKRIKTEDGLKNMQEAFRKIHAKYELVKYKRIRL